jgi:hypothetical protein
MQTGNSSFFAALNIVTVPVKSRRNGIALANQAPSLEGSGAEQQNKTVLGVIGGVWLWGASRWF